MSPKKYTPRSYKNGGARCLTDWQHRLQTQEWKWLRTKWARRRRRKTGQPQQQQDTSFMCAFVVGRKWIWISKVRKGGTSQWPVFPKKQLVNSVEWCTVIQTKVHRASAPVTEEVNTSVELPVEGPNQPTTETSNGETDQRALYEVAQNCCWCAILSLGAHEDSVAEASDTQSVVKS